MNYDAEGIGQALIGSTLITAVRHYPVALTVEALALGWLRQEEADHGALVVADREVAARSRSDESLAESAVNAAVIVRGEMPADHQDIYWATALLAAAAGCRVITAGARPWWPETIVAGETKVAAVRVSTQLAASRVRGAVLTVRLGFGQPVASATKLQMLAATAERLTSLVVLPPAELADAYRNECALVGRHVRVNQRPRGASGGVASSIDARGAFGTEATSSSIARHSVDQIRDIETVD